ncbi:hypothetical protein, partial [Candidatus Entotheonella palauensis]|uniref:hypothetical protein n=1 Tax=Candidatus Entotheonella palauensis TaxID=93172 RepID=UPI001C4DE685
ATAMQTHLWRSVPLGAHRNSWHVYCDARGTETQRLASPWLAGMGTPVRAPDEEMRGTYEQTES